MQTKLMCAIYTRVSTDQQAEKVFNSCEAQEEKIRAFIKSQEDLEAQKVYSDPGYTGANLDRPALSKMLLNIQEGEIDMVIVYKMDRLTRSPKDFFQLIELFDTYGVNFISVTERFDTSTPSGKLLRNIMLTFAQFERELISERTRDKMLQRAEKGFWNGGFHPYGYTIAEKKLVPDEKQAEIVRLIFKTYIETMSLAKVCEILRKKGLVTAQGNTFVKSHISYILRNRVYIGNVRYSKKFYKGIHEPIVSEDLYNQAQDIHQTKHTKMKLFREYLFSGLISCDECGKVMTKHYANKGHQLGRTKSRYFYYRCTSTFKNGWDACSTKQVNADRIEEFVFENLERISKDMPYIENLCFKLNHSANESGNSVSMKLNSGVRTGLELRAPSLKIDPERLISELQGFIQGLKIISKSDQSRLIKTKIQSIKYSKKSLRVNFYYPFKPNALTSFQSSSKEAEKSSCARVVSFEDKTNQPRPVSRSELVRNEKMARIESVRPTMPIVLPNTIHRCHMKNLKLLRSY